LLSFEDSSLQSILRVFRGCHLRRAAWSPLTANSRLYET
jgi:hypothetical protein